MADKLEEKVKECQMVGCSEEYALKLQQLLKRDDNVFRLKLGQDPPVDVPPLRVNVMPGAVPVRCKARRYSLEQRQFMKEHVAELEKAGLVFRLAVAQKEASIDEGRSNKVNAWVAETGVEARSIPCTIGGLVATAMLDSGADQSLACPDFLKRLEAAGQWVPIRKLKDEVDLGGFQEGLRVKISHEVKLDLMFSTYAGDLVLRNVVCWVSANPLAKGLGDVLVSRPVMNRMGYSTADLLGSACERQVEYDMVDADNVDGPFIAVLEKLELSRQVEDSPEEIGLHPLEETVCFPSATKDDRSKWPIS